MPASRRPAWLPSVRRCWRNTACTGLVTMPPARPGDGAGGQRQLVEGDLDAPAVRPSGDAGPVGTRQLDQVDGAQNRGDLHAVLLDHAAPADAEAEGDGGHLVVGHLPRRTRRVHARGGDAGQVDDADVDAGDPQPDVGGIVVDEVGREGRVDHRRGDGVGALALVERGGVEEQHRSLLGGSLLQRPGRLKPGLSARTAERRRRGRTARAARASAGAQFGPTVDSQEAEGTTGRREHDHQRRTPRCRSRTESGLTTRDIGPRTREPPGPEPQRHGEHQAGDEQGHLHRCGRGVADQDARRAPGRALHSASSRVPGIERTTCQGAPTR